MSRPDKEPEAPDAAAVVLAGGRSSRMGSPKAWLEFDGRPLLVHLVERLSGLLPEVHVVAAPDQDLPVTPAPVHRDQRPGEGPLAGLEVGLAAAGRPLVFVCSCDIPFLNPEVARYLISVCRCYDAAVPEWEGRLQPLQAVYRTDLRPLVSALLDQGRRRPADLFELARTCVVPESELRQVDPTGLSFLNMNTPEDYQAARRLWEERR